MTVFERKLHEHRQCRKYERVLRRLRLRSFDYEDAGQDVFIKARRIMERCSSRCAPQWMRERSRREDARLQRTPSYFEPGGGGTQ